MRWVKLDKTRDYKRQISEVGGASRQTSKQLCNHSSFTRRVPHRSRYITSGRERNSSDVEMCSSYTKCFKVGRSVVVLKWQFKTGFVWLTCYVNAPFFVINN